MAIKGITLIESFKWYSPRDKAESDNDKTTFVLGAVDGLIRAHIADNATAWISHEAGMQMVNKSSHRNLELVRFGLKSVENFKDDKGNDIPVEFVDRVINGKVYKVVADSFLVRLDIADIADMAIAILDANTVTDTERKNLVMPSSLPA